MPRTSEPYSSDLRDLGSLTSSYDTRRHTNVEIGMSQDWRSDYAKSADDYIKETNQYLGLSSFTAGIACIGKPQYFAWIALILIALIWKSRFDAFQLRLNALRAIAHESMLPKRILLKCAPAIAGWVFLGAVALQLLR